MNKKVLLTGISGYIVIGVNKNVYIRYQALDKCFSNQYRMFFIEDLLEEVN